MKKTILSLLIIIFIFIAFSHNEARAYDFYTAITSPTNNSVINGTITFSAIATESAGISKVEFYANNTLLNTDYSSPYSFSWNTSNLTQAATYTLKTVAFNKTGNSVESEPINVIKKDIEKPLVRILYPTMNQIIKAGTPLTIQATATDNIGVNKVVFYVNNITKCSSSVFPYFCTWQVPIAKNIKYNIKATVFDNFANSTSQQITVTTN